MALTRGMLFTVDDPLVVTALTTIFFQYNPHTVTRLFTTSTQSLAEGGASLGASQPPTEAYSLTLEFDATDGLEREGSLTAAYGVGPRLAAIEMLMQPVRHSPQTQSLSRLAGSGGTNISASRVPLTLFAWGKTLIVPVRLDSLTVTETAFDQRLNPIQAKADLGFTVLGHGDLEGEPTLIKAAAWSYQVVRRAMALLSMPQTLEQNR